MNSLTEREYHSLRAGAKVLTADSHGDKVLALPSGKILKLFRRKRLISSATLLPYSRRFAKNCATLTRLGIPTLSDIEEFNIKSIARTAVCYTPLAGESLRDILEAEQAFSTELIARFGAFLARLHEQGVYFRSLHLGNVLLTPSGELGLIDIADLRCYSSALSNAQRRRNFRHTCRYSKEREALYQGDRFSSFWEAYVQGASRLSQRQRKQLLVGIQDQLRGI